MKSAISDKKAVPKTTVDQAGRDLRPLVLFLFALVVLAFALKRQIPPAAPPQAAPQKTVWLEGLPEPGLYRLAADLTMSELYRQLGIESPAGPLSPEPIPDYASIQLRPRLPPRITKGLPPRLTPLFFQPIPLNQADSELLETISGIGPKMAGRIIGSREAYGEFRSLDELLTVKGIGPKTLEKLSGQLVVE